MNAVNKGMLGLDEIATPSNLRAYFAELVGTMVFVFAGTAAWIVAGGQSGDQVVIAFAAGIAIAAMVYATAHISGGHLNPAVTLAMILTEKMKALPGLIYIGAQMTGAALATALLYVILQDAVGNATDFGAHSINTGAVDGEGGAFLLEAILTAVLLIVIFAVTVSRKGFGIMGPLVIGLTVTLIHFVAVPLTGASVNPARTFGPALISNAFDSYWVYLLAPAFGGFIGAAAYKLFILDATEGDGDEEEEAAG